MRSFASDNYASVAPAIMDALSQANQAHEPAYGDDQYTQQATALFQHTFGSDTQVYFVYNGTAANSLAFKAVLRSHHSILCADTAHIATLETGAPENATGCKLIKLPQTTGKITPEDVEQAYLKETAETFHATLPRVLSITQATEMGTVYTPEEIQALSAVCQRYQLLLHVDGCRLFNAACALDVSLKALSKDCGVDLLSFGGTKNGLMFGEAIVFFRPQLAQQFAYVRKQGLQLHSKMRYLAAQFIPFLQHKLWHKYAQHANLLCQRLYQGLSQIDTIQVVAPVQTNQIFAILPQAIIDATQAVFPYYVYNPAQRLIRLVTSFDNTEQDVDQFIALAQAAS